jgi:hypothetical protein
VTKSVTISGVPNLSGNGIQPTTINGANLNTGSAMFSLDDSGGKMSVTFQNVQLLGGTSGRGISANGVGNGSSLTLTGTVIDGFNQGAIFAFAFNVTLNNSQLTFNTSNFGAGIFFVGRGSEALNILSSTIDDNEASGSGGGVEFEGNGLFTMINSTVALNTAGENGGGLALVGVSSPYTITGSTIAFNSADTGGGIEALIDAPSSFVIDGTIVSTNTANLEGPDFDMLESTGSTTVKNSQIGSTEDAVFADGGNNISGDPMFAKGMGGLDGSGGPFNISVLRLDVNSPARDHISTFSQTLDERGFPRGIGVGASKFDIGAVEMDPNTETETLSVVASNVGNLVVSDPKFSNGKGTDIHAGKTGDFVAYSVVVPMDGFYEAHVGVRTGKDEGKVQVMWSDTPNFSMANCPGDASTRGGPCHTEPVGPVIDLFSTTATYKDIPLVPYKFPYIIGVNYFKCQIVGKSHGGTGTGYQLFLDYFNLKFLMGNG